MFAHYVDDFADELMRAAMAGNEDMARQAGVTKPERPKLYHKVGTNTTQLVMHSNAMYCLPR